LYEVCYIFYLKWGALVLEGKRSLLIVLIAVLVFLSLAVAVLAGYVFVFTGPSNNAGNSASAENILNNAAASVKEEDLSSKLLFEQSKAMNLKSDDNKKINVILLNIEIKYFKSIKKVDEIVIRHDSKMKEIVATYFQGMTIDDVKNYLRVDFDITEDDNLIQSLMTAEQQYIVNQTGKQYKANDEVWNMTIKLLVAHWYEVRQLNPIKPGALSEYPHSVTALINHIAVCSAYDYADGAGV
jgi:uncharacterized phage protein (predicted DNA packaging)